jgi:hypothetical protein
MKKLAFALLVAAFAPPSASASDFAKLDADGNGEVTFEELTAAGVNWTQEQFAAADADQSRSLSQAEYEKAVASR